MGSATMDLGCDGAGGIKKVSIVMSTYVCNIEK